MNYKKSLYNYFVNDPDGVIVFNTLSGSVGKFSLETFYNYKNDLLSKKEVDMLLSKGILIPSDKDESLVLRNRRELFINNTKIKHFRIWTTTCCNARCYYCFEYGIATVSMSKETQEGVVHYIDKILQYKDDVRIDWFGGEPLLNIQAIDFITNQLISICERKQCALHFSMITNGSLIDEDIAIRMEKEWRIEHVQITLDGDREAYNIIKNYYNPKRCNFDNVIRSIKLLSKKQVSIAIRMNYTEDNYNNLSSLISFMGKELNGANNIKYYIYPIWGAAESSANSFDRVIEFDVKIIELFKQLIESKMSTLTDLIQIGQKNCACQACSPYSVAILPNGDLSKCSETYNYIIGNLKEGITDYDMYKYWINIDVDKKCASCVFLPICQGGCKAAHFNNMSQCFADKPIIDALLKLHIQFSSTHEQID